MNFVRSSHLFTESNEAGPLIVSLLAARATSAAAGNRRNLFASMDRLLSASPVQYIDGDSVSTPIASGGHAVRLARLKLRNWKSFERADLVFPSGEAGRSMIVVGGPNGFGKSSILEAYAFGLFGRRALSDIGFLISGTGRRADQRKSYRAMIERSLHRSDRAREDGICSVLLEFDTADGPVVIERKWYFNDRAALIEEEEEVLVRVGTDWLPLEVPVGLPSREWYQEEIERRVMPADLAPFFLFDGEQVERWSERKLSDQVRSAMTRMLGLSDLRALADDLRDYSRDRERGLTDGDANAGETLRSEVDRLEHELADETARITAFDEQLRELRQQREVRLRALAQGGGMSHADLQARLERQHRLAADRKRLTRELVNAMMDEGPLMLAGTKLLLATRSAINLDGVADALQLQRDEIDILWTRFAGIDPPLDAATFFELKARFETACAPGIGAKVAAGLHAQLERNTRRMLQNRLDASSGGRARIADAARALEDVVRQIGELDAAAQRQEQDARRSIDTQKELTNIAGEIEAKEHDRGAISRHINSLAQSLKPSRDRLAALRAMVSEAEPRMRTATAARSLAATLETHVASAADGAHERFAEAVTASFKTLAHKDQVSKIEIFADGGIRVVDRKNRDITDYRLSAGESQLFAMALIAAVGTLVGDRLPLMVDTPLGRLDTKHRQSVLDMLAERRSQTILLTQPEELSEIHLERVRHALAGSMHLDHEVDAVSGIGASSVVPDRTGTRA